MRVRSAPASAFAVLATIALPLSTPAQQQQAPPPTGAQPPQQGQQQQRRAPRPYAQVITDKAVTDAGGITVHRVDDRWFFEVPDSLVRRDFLLVSRVAGVPSNFGGFTSAGTSIEERVVRWERHLDRVLLRAVAFDAVADDSLPIALSVHNNNVGPILAAFPIQAFTRDSMSYVLDVTDFFAGDTPAISGLTAAQRRQYQVRRLDPARSYINAVRSFPLNIELRHTQTYDAAEPPPPDRSGSTMTIAMSQSIVLLPKEPMRPRYADVRVGFFSIERVNYGLDEQKAATQRFIRRWRLEPKDPAAYARGELVEPIKPIVYYIDPATPLKWRPYVRQGVQDWQVAFEKAGFKNAILAKDPPSSKEDPEWDPEDIRYSVVRWAASLVRNAVGPSTSDPRTGEIIESDITWYHNHMRSYRNRLMIETGAANPAARSLEIPEDLMGETMRKVVTHEVGHALGLPHNMVASSAFPVDSLRKASFAKKYGVSATIMDYARQNYVAQPGDGLEPKDFVRRLGPFDDFVINWGYRVLPNAATPEAERTTLNEWITKQNGPMPYRYVPQFLAGIDPRAQTEDIGDDPVRATTFALANLKRIMPNMILWTTRPGEDFGDLGEIYSETLGMWALYMGHVTTVIGGVNVDFKSAEQDGAVFTAVPKERQKAALQFLSENAFTTPEWLVPRSILSRLGPPTGATSLANRQAGVVTQLLDARRLTRLSDAEAFYGPTPPPAAGQPGGGGGPGPQGPVFPLLAPPNVQRGDLPALARRELRTIQSDARRAAAAASAAVTRAHWLDVADRIGAILEPRRER